MKCVGCGGEKWVAGRAEIGGKGGFQFRPEKSKLMVLSWPSIETKVCQMCGNVIFSVELEKLRSVMKEG